MQENVHDKGSQKHLLPESLNKNSQLCTAHDLSVTFENYIFLWNIFKISEAEPALLLIDYDNGKVFPWIGPQSPWDACVQSDCFYDFLLNWA